MVYMYWNGKWMVYFMENPFKMDDLEVPLFQETSIYKYIYIYIWVNYNDLTATSLESWLIREIIPKWP